MTGAATVQSTADSMFDSVKPRSLWMDAWRRLLKNKLAVASGIVLILMVAVALLTPRIAPYDYEEQDLAGQYQSPSHKHWMGTDMKGRDILTRVMWGARISFAVGFVATGVSLLIGVTWGAIAGFAGGRVDNFMMRFVDILYGLPYMFVVILLMTYVGRSIVCLFIGLGLVEWLTMSRIVRASAISLKQKEFVEAARALGARSGRIIFRHLIPNLLGPVIVYSTLTVPRVMLQEAFLSFLGLGVQAPQCSWGSLANVGASVTSPIQTYWWLIVFPGAALAITLLALNALGDGLRDALDPRGSM
ncbi:MAG: ABC transporter permease [Planctomycetota bacterium]